MKAAHLIITANYLEFVCRPLEKGFDFVFYCDTTGGSTQQVTTVIRKRSGYAQLDEALFLLLGKKEEKDGYVYFFRPAYGEDFLKDVKMIFSRAGARMNMIDISYADTAEEVDEKIFQAH
ncbi:MAG: hypothetical protein PHO56_01270 [Patescibacteria group bacterium]|nr:hypothetical protein [Patescibacteria group bacterium]